MGTRSTVDSAPERKPVSPKWVIKLLRCKRDEKGKIYVNPLATNHTLHLTICPSLSEL